MTRKLKDQPRTKAIVSDVWLRVKAIQGESPTWNYMALCQMVDMMLEDNPGIDGRDIGDAIMLCWRLDEPITRRAIAVNMIRVDRGRQGVVGYR